MSPKDKKKPTKEKDQQEEQKKEQKKERKKEAKNDQKEEQKTPTEEKNQKEEQKCTLSPMEIAIQIWRWGLTKGPNIVDYKDCVAFARNRRRSPISQNDSQHGFQTDPRIWMDCLTLLILNMVPKTSPYF